MWTDFDFVIKKLKWLQRRPIRAEDINDTDELHALQTKEKKDAGLRDGVSRSGTSESSCCDLKDSDLRCSSGEHGDPDRRGWGVVNVGDCGPHTVCWESHLNPPYRLVRLNSVSTFEICGFSEVLCGVFKRLQSSERRWSLTGPKNKHLRSKCQTLLCLSLPEFPAAQD